MRLCFVCLVIFFFLFVSLNAVNRYVPNDYSTIQAALNASASGDTVFVAPGIYTENIVWTLVDGIVLKSTGTMLNTIIDANHNGRGIGFVCSFNNPIITSATKVDGFTIRNGYSNLNGAGMICYFASPEISNCVLTRNECTSMGSGGGLYCYGASPHFNNVLIVRNIAYSGGGAHIDPMSSPVFNNCVFADNSLNSPGGSYAAGIYGRYEVYYQLNNCTVARNRYFDTAAIHIGEVCSPTIQHSLITDNTYGVEVMSDGGLNLHNSNILYNSCGVWHNDNDGDTFSVTNNWWGSNTGPFHITNPSGMGDTIEGNASFSDWLLSPDTSAPILPPSGLLLSDVTLTSVNVSWGYESNANINHYEVNYGTDSLAVIQNNNLSTENMVCTLSNLLPHTRYFIQIAAVDNNNNKSWYSALNFITTSETSADDPVLQAPEILCNYPNPFSGITRIWYNLKQPGHTLIHVYNIKGELIRHLFNGKQASGSGDITWNGKDDNNRVVAAGIYFVKLEQNGITSHKKLILIR